MTREDYFHKWRDRLCGLALRGLVFDSDERPAGEYGAGRYAMQLPSKIDRLISELWADAQNDSTKPASGSAQRREQPK